MKDYLMSSLSLLDGIKSFANQYGFTSILKDVRDLTIDYNSQLNYIDNLVKTATVRRYTDNG